MATTPTTRVTTLARTHRLDADTATYPAVQYQQVYGQEDLKLIEELRTEEDEMHEGAGAMRETNTGYSWRLELKLAYSTNLAGTSIDAVHAFLRSRFKMHRAQRVEEAEFGVRFYNRDGLDSGHDHEGRCYVKSWTMPGGKGADRIDVVLQGQGALTDITNPAADLTPVVTGLDPATGAEAGGEIINIFGQHFKAGGVDATDVDFGANAADFTVVNDSHIVAVAPAGTSTVQVQVTNATGASADTAADNYIYT
ncbi:IPT/TIG domain-containing protein [Micromonospora sp. Llam0]|uniref:IPT/TIG domain-containing protein n=1 Tax=Micromonospora sp. Llam0 TaxID=2485143 RepID=UPI000F4A29DF|nr:IPT/TIG domain-containing protein [Micromonospora sp. Llam0]ROO51078.1 IPT/TIG domain-containing protein [Micromonospora sp. Llam0]